MFGANSHILPMKLSVSVARKGLRFSSVIGKLVFTWQSAGLCPNSGGNTDHKFVLSVFTLGIFILGGICYEI